MAAREAWPDRLADVPTENLVFVDETGTNTTMQRTHGYAPKGERLVGYAPQGEWTTVTFVGALTVAGMVAPWAQPEAMTKAVFTAWVEQFLVPALRPGMVVVMDNLSCHKGEAIELAIAAAGCRLEYLPAYSPDFNPIEKAFSQFKRVIRSAAARTVEGVYEAMKDAIDQISPTHCRNYFHHCGY
jgi:transposase